MLLLPLTVVRAVGKSLAGIHVPGHRRSCSGAPLTPDGNDGGDGRRRSSVDAGSRRRRSSVDAGSRRRRSSVDGKRPWRTKGKGGAKKGSPPIAAAAAAVNDGRRHTSVEPRRVTSAAAAAAASKLGRRASLDAGTRWRPVAPGPPPPPPSRATSRRSSIDLNRRRVPTVASTATPPPPPPTPPPPPPSTSHRTTGRRSSDEARLRRRATVDVTAAAVASMAAASAAGLPKRATTYRPSTSNGMDGRVSAGTTDSDADDDGALPVRLSFDRSPTETEVRAWAGGSPARARRVSIEVGGVEAGRGVPAAAASKTSKSGMAAWSVPPPKTAASTPAARPTMRGARAAAAVARGGRLGAAVAAPVGQVVGGAPRAVPVWRAVAV